MTASVLVHANWGRDRSARLPLAEHPPRRPDARQPDALITAGRTARKHGIADEDIEHATAHAMAIGETDNDTRLYLGPARGADLLELVTIVRDDGTELADPRDEDAREVPAAPSGGRQMTKRKQGKTASGKPITDPLVAELAEKAEAGYDVDQLLHRRGGRPPIGSGPASVESVRLDPELRDALARRAERDHETTSAVIRKALRRYLDRA